MPGLVGLITRMPRAEAERQLAAMLKPVCHESFYSVGTWSDESLGVYVGWTAMSGSFSDGMPLCNRSRDLCLVFSGEEYSEERVRFQQSSNDGDPRCGYLIRECERNRDFVQNLNGLFHGLIADRRNGEVVIFNDRYGMHRLCYFQSNDNFYFAAEAKAILAVHPETREFDYKSLGEFASLGCVLEDRTIFRKINVLPGASQWKFKGARLVGKNRYFDPRNWEEQGPLPREEYYRNLRSTLATNLPRYFSETQKMGIAMTGGLDTRVILANHPPSPGSLPGYTFGGPYRESQDVIIGRRIAELCGQTHQVIEVGERFLNEFPNIARRTVFVTEGTVDLSRADLYLSQRVREIAPAKIVGTYGSEIVRHAVMFKPVEPPAGLLSPDFTPNLREAASTFARLRHQHPVTFAAFRQSPWYHHGVLALEKSQITVHSPFLDNDFVRTVYRAPQDTSPADDIRLQLIKDASPTLGAVRSDRGIGGNGSNLSSALRHALLEFTFKAEYAYDYGMPQWVASIDHALSALRLERCFLGRHKLLHFRVWYRDQLASYIRQILLDPKALSRAYIQRNTLESIIDSHLRGNRNYTTAIHRLLTMELLHQLFVDDDSKFIQEQGSVTEDMRIGS